MPALLISIACMILPEPHYLVYRVQPVRAPVKRVIIINSHKLIKERGTGILSQEWVPGLIIHTMEIDNGLLQKKKEP